MGFKRTILHNIRRVVGTSLALSLIIAQTAGAASSVKGQLKSHGNLEVDANGDDVVDTLFHSEDLYNIADGYDFVSSKLTALDASYTALINTTNSYKSSIITGLNNSVRQNSNLASTTSFNDIITAINDIPNQASKSYALTPANTSTDITEGYYNGKGKITITSGPASGKSAVTAGTMLTGYSGWVSGTQINGTMPNQAAKNYALTPANTSTAITAGYYNGSGKITISSGPASGKSAVTAGTMLTGYSGWVNGTQINGTMANQAAKNYALTPANTSTAITAGYYNGSGKITISSGPASGKSAVTAATMLTGYSGWVNGAQINGSMPNNGSLTKSLNPGGSQAIAAGYYSGGTITANKNTDTYTFPANSTGAKYDMLETNLVRYVDATNVYAKGKADGITAGRNDTPGNATAATILKNYTAWVAGTKLTGTMGNYSSSTAQSCSTANTSGKLYVKPSNAGYYTSSSSFNTGIAYNPDKTVSNSTSTHGATGNGTSISANTIYLGKDKKAVLPKGYYSSDQTIQSVGSGGDATALYNDTLKFTLTKTEFLKTSKAYSWVFVSFGATGDKANFGGAEVTASGGTRVSHQSNYYNAHCIAVFKNVPSGTAFSAQLTSNTESNQTTTMKGWVYGIE